MLPPLILFINFARAALQSRNNCNDPEMHDQCFAECRLSYLECRANCDSQLCDSGCLAEFQECESTCPCGLDCPAGCRDCKEHPPCQDECKHAQLNNLDYQICLNKVSKTNRITTTTPIEPRDVFILVIPYFTDKSYLQHGDGYFQINATINAPKNDYAWTAAHALVNGELHIFGGNSDGYKIARLDSCVFTELPARLNEERRDGNAAVSIENGQKALVCFGYNDDTRKSCEIFAGSSAAPTFAAEWTHKFGGLGLFKNQPATVGCFDAEHQKAETLSAAGWTALPDFSLKISSHSLVGLENGGMLLLGGYDWGSDGYQTGIWELKEEYWSRIGELLKPASRGSAIYVSRSVYYFEGSYSAIYRLDLDENEELEAVEEIGRQSGPYSFPVLFQMDNGYCFSMTTTTKTTESTATPSSATSKHPDKFFYCLMIILMTLLCF